MRWSWPAFGAGSAAGAMFVLLLLGGTCGDAPVPSEPAAPNERPTPVAAASVRSAPRVRATESASTDVTPAATSEPAVADVEVPVAGPEDGTPETTGPADHEGTSVEIPLSGRIVTASGFTLRANIDVTESLVFVFTADGSGPTSVSAPVQQGLARARAAAEALAASGRGTSEADVDALLRSSDDGDREAAIGLATRSAPPMTARLLAVARDATVGGSVRATALVAAAEAAPGDPSVGTAVAALTSDKDVTVRRTAIELLPRFPKQGGDRAIAILRAGDYSDVFLDALARTVAASDRAGEFLFGSLAPDAAFAVIRALAHTEPVDANARTRLLARLPDAIRPLLGLPEMLANAGEAFGAAATSGHVVFLRSVAVSPSLPTALRLAAVDAAIAAPECADGRAALLASALADGRSPVEFLRAVLQRVPAGDVADGNVKSSIAALAESHGNEWLREEARAKLQASPVRADAGGLKILSGIYGKDGKTVDVTDALRSMVVGGRLVVEAGNALAGDPLVGVVKDLTIAYEWKGERRTRTIREYETLTLP
jgi:hypothetical protein